ncbi:DMT family transporter [Sedimentitalea todarodis]|uniref:DMT family transporter n=1 Tax=Sedimentitalea todarodis TaxID=1631240 RepID=A0ABU3VCL9_9RHOB|nr:DMT family transporter [Sedimentitalea todarodis]MDU9003823.1 DMT family transporter [Sedimentitalea todarodis]
MRAAAFGAALVVIYTALISSADAITKLIAGGYAAPQLFCLSGLIVVALCALADRHRSQQRGFRTHCPRAMALRAGATVLAAVSFFYAFRHLPFAEVFLFIGLMPILAGLMSGLILGEHVRPAAWAALVAGFVGVMCLFPTGLGSVTVGHGFALAAAVFGTLSMIMARFIGRYESNSLAQVFYPNLAIFGVMALALPFVWQPMPLSDLGLIVAYAALLFGARWLLVVALRLLAAYAVTPLMNLQFVWMVGLGAAFFGEFPAPGTYLGVAIVIGSGLFLVWDQFVPATTRPAVPSMPLRINGIKTDL